MHGLSGIIFRHVIHCHPLPSWEVAVGGRRGTCWGFCALSPSHSCALKFGSAEGSNSIFTLAEGWLVS